ncbi:glucokinase [Thiomicrorhabdus aquaedulcis]|uniref:glucokinase n=1 Tax=Thiomicrorhabdus aquaedulcis TaxID=2211106 RepID=UPI000FDC4CF8|nr:glucokinase [Thiomicrorhabdus aquaedulcis]
MLFLAGDIGGTKALLQLIEVRSSSDTIVLAKQHYLCKDFNSLESIVSDFLSHFLSMQSSESCAKLSFKTKEILVERACFGLPGPVSGRKVKLTNLPWEVDADAIEKACFIQSVCFVNDFYAAALGVQTLTDENVVPLYQPFNIPTHANGKVAGNRLVIGAGTGLGLAPIFYDGARYLPVSCEGGHFDFAPISETQQLLLNWLWQTWEHVSYERVLSGPGIETLYTFFKLFDCPPTYSLNTVIEAGDLSVLSVQKNTLKPLTPFGITQTTAYLQASALLAAQPSLNAAQIHAAAEQGDPTAIKALTEFVTIYGAFVGAAALIWHAPQGIYLAGGIADKLLNWMLKPYFKQALLEKGRMAGVIAKMPVFLVTDASLGLRGAMQHNFMDSL